METLRRFFFLSSPLKSLKDVCGENKESGVSGESGESELSLQLLGDLTQLMGGHKAAVNLDAVPATPPVTCLRINTLKVVTLD